MADKQSSSSGATLLEIGGLRFEVTFRGPEIYVDKQGVEHSVEGATMRVEGPVDDKWTELFKFDDFLGDPHFHVPGSARSTSFDRSLGEPLQWFISEIRDHLAEWMVRAGYERLLPEVDIDEISASAGRLADAMIACVPKGYVRVPGIGLQRVDTPAKQRV